MLDIKFIREDPKIVKESIKKRFQNEKLPLVDRVIKNYNEWIKSKQKIEKLKHKRNIISKEINELQKAGQGISKKVKEAKNIPDEIKKLEEKQKQLNEKIKSDLLEIPNIMHKSVPIGKDETKNKVIKKWGKIPKFKFKIKNHVELVEDLGVADFDASVKTTGAGFYVLKKESLLQRKSNNCHNSIIMTKFTRSSKY